MTFQFNNFRLLDICIERLDSRTSYQVSAGLRRYLSQPVKNLYKVEESKAGEADRGGVSGALRLVESTRKVLECPVCYLACPPPRIYQCNNGHLTCAPCHSQTRQCPASVLLNMIISFLDSVLSAAQPSVVSDLWRLRSWPLSSPRLARTSLLAVRSASPGPRD